MLGKEGSSLVEPVGLEIRRTRAGIGREDSRKENRKREEEKMEWERGKEEALMEDFGCRHKEQWRNRRIVVNYHKAKAALEQLANKEVVAEADKNEEDAENEEEEEEIITEEDLQDILIKPREEYQSRLLRGCQYESMEALLSNCLGTNEDDH
ncbi:G patch domain-containing protein 11 [Camellia lanceoleosa]|uniref:G patch domain-containing protein 11 n=1 Tax=Camellia lanceoleosa TaxID=1840588 RepID=A0ACC0HWP2_9ERIC|nr:G patch domain-containing protein 11 [Camellia lanceoleosa]